MELISGEELVKAGWKKIGNAWYGPNSRSPGLTNYEDKWQKWVNGMSIDIQYMNQLNNN